MSPVTVQPAQTQDIPQIRTVLARSLAHDPMLQWLFPPGNTCRESRISLFFSAQVERFVSFGVAHKATDEGRVVGAALWIPHDTARLDTLPRPGELTEILCGPQRAAECSRQFQQAREDAPACDAPYLATLGVLASHRGQGIGQALVEAGHSALGPDTWLESCNPANLSLYLRLGYQLIHQAPFADGSTVFTRLLRTV